MGEVSTKTAELCCVEESLVTNAPGKNLDDDDVDADDARFYIYGLSHRISSATVFVGMCYVGIGIATRIRCSR